jgi:hypothetical protein
VWLDPVVPGSSVLGTFEAGDATITVVPLGGGAGTRHGTGLVVSIDGQRVYATAEYEGDARLHVHRVSTLTVSEIGASLPLVTPVVGPFTTFRPAYDFEVEEEDGDDDAILYVPYSDGMGGGFLAGVDLVAFEELDLGPNPGVDALPLPDGAGPAAYEPRRNQIYVIFSDETTAGFVAIDTTDDLDLDVARENTVGTPNDGFPTPDGQWFVNGLAGYVGLEGLERSSTTDPGSGTTIDVNDDVGGVLQGSNRVAAFLRDPASENVFVFADDGSKTILLAYDVFIDDVDQVDLDLLTAGDQGIDLSSIIPGVVTGGATLLGSSGP